MTKMPDTYYVFWSAVVAITLLANAGALWWISKRPCCPCHQEVKPHA